MEDFEAVITTFPTPCHVRGVTLPSHSFKVKVTCEFEDSFKKLPIEIERVEAYLILITGAFVPYEAIAPDGGLYGNYGMQNIPHQILARAYHIDDIKSKFDEWYSHTDKLLKIIPRNSILDRAIIFYGKGYMDLPSDSLESARSSYLWYCKVLECLEVLKTQYKENHKLRCNASHIAPEEKIAHEFRLLLKPVADASRMEILKRIAEEYGLELS